MIQTTTRAPHWANSILSPISSKARKTVRRERAMADPNYFGQLYRELTERRFSNRQRQTMPVPGIEHDALDVATASLRQNGVYVWRGLFADAEWLTSAQTAMSQIVDRWEMAYGSPSSAEASIGDPEREPVLHRGNRSQNGRLRATCNSVAAAPAEFQDVMTSAALQEVISRYFDADAQCNYLLAERLTPSKRGDFWHIDRIVDQVKVMVLLTDVEAEQGPLRLKRKTHKYNEALEPIYYSVFTRGVDYAYPPGPLVEKMSGTEIFGTGKAGDCIVFDTLALHSGTACQEGRRDALVGTWFGTTQKTKTLQELADGRWI